MPNARRHLFIADVDVCCLKLRLCQYRLLYFINIYLVFNLTSLWLNLILSQTKSTFSAFAANQSCSNVLLAFNQRETVKFSQPPMLFSNQIRRTWTHGKISAGDCEPQSFLRPISALLDSSDFPLGVQKR